MKIWAGWLVAAATIGSLGVAQAQERPPITSIAFAHVYAAQPDASITFYKSLGFVPETLGKTTRFAVNDSQWIDVDPLPQPAPAAHWDAMGFTTTDVKAMARYLESKGVKITEPLKNGEIGVRDPEGNSVFFVQAGSYKRTVAQRVDKLESSHRIIHTGIIVRDKSAEDKFYRDILGFTPYWYGGMTDTRTDFVSLQVPNGTDWLEYMMNQPAEPTLRQAGMMDHFSLGVEHMSDAVAALQKTHCEGPNCTKTQMGRDGKVQLNVFDPDYTRIEFMEFKPSGPICCSAFTGKHPTSAAEPQ
jgi:catechol 2,3-dioxygenase-like lactoylglutathione lyase family enzyme